ncbi:zf-HC2 domain-containing protein [Gordonia sp. PP30]|uniref:zf-HC2 domain-containing protein n=1 Tax=unclassified Gordonia (in: high G+C Gram-positive bacteria) TaxID=2657482 RepID=UPI001FFE6A5B|nr:MULTISPECIES: zf-HC2 domain-containing protein [unclassified Gordonia (in: high G+C Gram-positive bacteria)]UQE76285.1 zf-HC2 domain-containing protein [Gordonia sp. PP30]
MGDERSSRPGRWAPVGATFAPNPEYRAGRAFGSTDHLAADAVVAYVDGVLSASAQGRAERHLALCTQCAAEVAAQAGARSVLRASRDVSAPMDLIGQLSKIPTREIDVRDLDRRSR